MKAYEIRDITTAAVAYAYQNQQDHPVTFGGLWGDPTQYTHVEVAIPSPLTNIYNE